MSAATKGGFVASPVSLDRIQDDPQFTLLDNLTLFHADRVQQEVLVRGGRFNERSILELARHPQHSALLGLTIPRFLPQRSEP